jgi:N-acetyl-anhydromuramyl-L-alanine amidase AmpD
MSIDITFNNEFLNKTVCKSERENISMKITSGHVLENKPAFALWHDTGSPNWTAPLGTLRYNLKANLQNGKMVSSSYDYLIDWYGIIWHYVEEEKFISYNAGDSKFQLGDKLFEDYDLNRYSVGIELDLPGKENILPSPAQIESAAKLAVYLMDRWDIPLNLNYHPGHKDVCVPHGRKTDPTPDYRKQVLERAQTMIQTAQPKPINIDPRFAQSWSNSGGLWKLNSLTPGYPIGSPWQDGIYFYQRFERGIARLKPDNSVEWLLLDEIQKITGH